MVLCVILIVVFFFFKQKTAYEMRISDWSSDVCSSDLTGDARNELPARARVDLPIRLDIEGVGSRSCEELVAPVPRDAGLDRTLVVIGNGIGAVAEAGQRELRHRRRLTIVIGRIAVDDRIVQDDAAAGIPEAELKRELQNGRATSMERGCQYE